MKIKIVLLLLSASMILFTSCGSKAKKTEPATKNKASNPGIAEDVTINKDGGIPIFYNMYLSVEMSSLFQSIGATYNQKILNSPDKYDTYNLSTDKALNLGVYAVDLSYTKYFDQFEQAGKYLKTMHKLSTDLGIPDEKFFLSIKRIETNLTNKDSLIKIANELYTTTEIYLKENERASAAALIIVGGWIEALYIATNMLNKHANDIDLIERMAEQKYSLNDLIDLLKKYEKETIIKEYLAILFDLKASFTKFQIDTKNMDVTYKQLNEISLKISSLRKKIVS